jgi:hypothetical protein
MAEKGSCVMFAGLLSRKERWGLAWRGWAVLTVLLLLAGLGFLAGSRHFLAVTHRVDSNVLVVEGWGHPYAMDAAVKEFNAGHYDRAFTTGGPVEGMGGYVNDYCTSASVGAGLLKAAGLPDKVIQMVPSRVWNRDRTYYSAVALRDWFKEHNLQVQSFNIVTEGAHARRTRMLFQEAFGRDVQVGIISVPSPDYDEKHWWRCSEGVREVIGESIAYVYAKFFFWPGRGGGGR